MSSAQAKTIQIFLPTGEPRGIRVAELTTRIVQAVAIPRSDLATAKARAELDHVAVYFLFGESEGAAKPIVYIGQTEDVRKRLDQHNANKDFWQTAVLGISRTHSITQAHIQSEILRIAVKSAAQSNASTIVQMMASGCLGSVADLDWNE